MTFREKCSFAVQVLRESMTFSWCNRVLWKYVGLFFFAVIVVGIGAGLLAYFLGKTLLAKVLSVSFVCVSIVVLFWIMFAFMQKVTALLQGRDLTVRESFKSSLCFMWQFILGIFLLSCGYSFFVLPIKLVPEFSIYYWLLLPIAVVGYWIIALIAVLFAPILFSERIKAVPALKMAVSLAPYWDIMTLAYILLLVALYVPLMLLMLAMKPILFVTLSIVLFPFMLLWLMYAFLVMVVFWFVFYNKIKSVH